ncbi:MAG: hypothetical protein RI911_403 [Candidatus Parcubacteria bacterium]|jgi:antitoxin component of MazEF toxin-antitoxin module
MESTQQQILIDAFNELPAIVQRAILSSELETKMRSLAQKHKIHLDKWTLLENEITYALFGITAPEDLPNNIVSHVGLSKEEAVTINNDAVEIIFEPIRKQLQDTIAAEKAGRSAAVAPIEQQKVLNEIGTTVPGNQTQGADKTLNDIIKKRLAGEQQIVGSKAVNNAGDSESARTTIKEDPYRELPL